MTGQTNFLNQAAAERHFLQLHYFVDKTIGPWATQARISQIIADDFDEMALDRSVQAAVDVTFGKGSGAHVGNAAFTQVAPSRIGPIPQSKKTNNAVHRGVTEQEMFGGVAAIRLYVTIFSEVQVAAGGTTPYKDVHQNRWTKKITIYSGDQTPVLWVNAGQPLRALKWLQKYKVESPAAKPVIRSFCIPVADYLSITKNAILEHDASKPENRDASFNVDRHYASDQFGIRGADLQTLQDKALKGSLITYADSLSYSNMDFGGEIRLTRDLRQRLGVPDTEIANENVFVNPASGEFQKKDKFGGIADKLMNIYGTWMGNELFFSDAWKKIPVMRRSQLLREYLLKYGLKMDDTYFSRILGGSSPASIARTIPGFR